MSKTHISDLQLSNLFDFQQVRNKNNTFALQKRFGMYSLRIQSDKGMPSGSRAKLDNPGVESRSWKVNKILLSRFWSVRKLEKGLAYRQFDSEHYADHYNVTSLKTLFEQFSAFHIFFLIISPRHFSMYGHVYFVLC